MSSKFKEYSCYSCDSNFKIKHEMDPTKYPVVNCPFCGSELEDDDIYSDNIEDFDEDL